MNNTQHYTPRPMVESMAYWISHVASLIGLERGSLYDPCAGNGDMLRWAKDAMDGFGKHLSNSLSFEPTRVFGNEIDPTQAALSEYVRCRDVFDVFESADVVIANPPYAGRSKLRSVVGDDRFKWLKKEYKTLKAGSADLAAYVFRHVMTTAQPKIAAWLCTNTMTEGSSHRVGFKHVYDLGYRPVVVSREFPWPGVAAVIVQLSVWVSPEFGDIEKCIEAEVLT